LVSNDFFYAKTRIFAVKPKLIETTETISFYNNRFKASEKKNLFNAASTGNLEEVRNLIENNPALLKLTNKSTNKQAIFYSTKHAHADITLYLYRRGQRLAPIEFERIFSNTSIPDQIYLFAISLKEMITDLTGWKGTEQNREALFERLKTTCYRKNNFTGLEKLFEAAGKKPDWGQIIREYRSYHPNNLNSQFIRDITLKYLLDEKI